MEQRSVAITGAAGAIGSVVARRFAEAGWRLGLIDYSEDHLDELRQTFPKARAASADTLRLRR